MRRLVGGNPARLGTGAALLVSALLPGCDFPTDLPEFESRWVVPGEETRFGVAELLPGRVTVAPDSSTFIVDFDPVAFASSLADLCAACVPLHGLTVPKPPFAGTMQSQIDFPAEVYEISVLSGQVVLEVQNLFGFDPIQPSADTTGTITLRITDDADGDVLSELIVDGATTSFPSGTTLTEYLTLAPTDVNGSLVATVEFDSPLGDAVMVDTAAVFSVVATPTNLRVVSVSVDVSNRSVAFDTVDLDVADIDEELSSRVVEGGFLLDVVNPFGIGATFDLSITGFGVPTIQRNATLDPAAMSSLRLDFSGAEIQSFLGQQNVQITGGAVVDSTAGIVTVRPGEELILNVDLDLTLRVGGAN